MKQKVIVLGAVILLQALSLNAAELTVTGKDRQMVGLTPSVTTNTPSSVRAMVEYNTAGAMDTPATAAGDRDGWGTEFITRWDNTTGEDITIIELGWPCGGWWSNFWYVWITTEMPADPYTLEHFGSFVAAVEDDTEYPPSQYTYIDMTDEGIIIPAGASMYFGYGNPGLAGQVYGASAETFSWYEDGWDSDNGFGRTTILQFKGDPSPVPTRSESFDGVKALYR